MNNLAGADGVYPSSFNRFCIQQISMPAAPAARYSASFVDLVTTGCSLLRQHTTPVPSFTIYPDVDFPQSLSPPWSASLKVINISLSVDGSGPYSNFISSVPFK